MSLTAVLLVYPSRIALEIHSGSLIADMEQTTVQRWAQIHETNCIHAHQMYQSKIQNTGMRNVIKIQVILKYILLKLI